MTPEQLVACVDFRYIADALTPDEALAILRRERADARRAGGGARSREGFPAYSTSAGWLGYPTRSCRQLAREALAEGFTHLKLKVGGDLDDDLRRARDRARGDRPRRTGSRSTRTRRGTSTQAIDALRRARARSTRTGSRSRRARTTSSATGASARRSRRSGSRPASTSRTGWSSSSSCSSGRSTSARSTAAGSAASTRCSRCCCWPRSSACRCARTPAASGCASTPSTSRSSTTSRSAASLDDRVMRVRRPPARALRRPGRVVGGRYLAPTAPGYSIEIRPESLAEFAFPDGPGWLEASAA